MAQSTSTSIEIDAGATLTRHQWAALRRGFNLADGHSRQSQSQAQLDLLERLPELYRDSIDADQGAEEAEFAEAFFAAAGQASVATLPEPIIHYSASVSFAIAATHLHQLGGVAQVVHPTFDNIPALLSHYSVPARPVSFDELLALTAFDSDVSSLVLVVPNNPTGESLDPAQLDRIARFCAERDVELVMDFSFRFVSDLHLWDQYEVLKDSGARFVCVEDTGKTWPVLDLKVGMVVSSPELETSIREITEDYLLNVSPFLLKLLTEYIRSDPDRSWLAVADENRGALEASLDGSDARVLDGRAARTIAWVELGDGVDSDEFCRWANENGVAVCPGGPFYWDNPEEGRRYIRVALLRPLSYFEAGAKHLRQLMDSFVAAECV